MRRFGKVDIPREAIITALKVDSGGSAELNSPP
jgi:hypothetical protein